MKAVLMVGAALALMAFFAMFDRERAADAQEHVGCLAEFGGGTPGSAEYVKCRHGRAARAGRVYVQKPD